MKSNFSITGIILAGGKSSRMKHEKAFLKLGAKTIIEELISRLKKKFSKFIIIANDTRKYMKFGTSTSPIANPESNRRIGIEVISDILPEKGPLGGIYTALVKSDTFYNFVFACDMPFINQNLIRYMLKECRGYDITIADYNGRLQPLCAIYSKNCIEPIKKQLEKNNLKIRDFFDYVKVRKISKEEIAKFDSDGFSFSNINTPEEYQALMR